MIGPFIDMWLRGRKQRVALERSCSNCMGIFSGFPQGTVFQPILFIIFILDLDNCVVL